MPCPNCPETKILNAMSQGTFIHPVLDRTELMLTQAWIAEVRPEQQQLVRDLIKTIQALKHPYTIPLDSQLINLITAANEVSAQILCFYCRGATYWGMVQKIKVHWHMERGEYGAALKLEVWSDVMKWIWMARAAWVRLLRPKLSQLIRRSPTKKKVPLNPN